MASSTRSVVSYEDITLPPPPQPHSHSLNPPPAKKRKWSKKAKGRDAQSFNNSRKTNSNNVGYAQGSSLMAMDVEDENVEEDEEGRDLTHDEIWDDSALIDAWNAATEEYEAYNGPEKGWKGEPIHKSPLWYNTPKTKEKSTAPIPAVPDAAEQEDSQPFNFDTFVPSHDPSLAVPIPGSSPIPGADGISQLLSEPAPIVSQDEAFTRAMGAMYWSGYWTAMYHCQRRLAQQPSLSAVQKGEEESYEEEYAEDEDGEEEEEVFVSTQR